MCSASVFLCVCVYYCVYKSIALWVLCVRLNTAKWERKYEWSDSKKCTNATSAILRYTLQIFRCSRQFWEGLYNNVVLTWIYVSWCHTSSSNRVSSKLIAQPIRQSISCNYPAGAIMRSYPAVASWTALGFWNSVQLIEVCLNLLCKPADKRYYH